MAEMSEESLGNQEKRCHVGHRKMASVADKELVKGRAQCGNPDLKARRRATHASAAEGVDVAISAWIAEERNRALGQGLTEEGGKLRGCSAGAARGREFDDWEKFNVSWPLLGGTPSRSIVNTPWVRTLKMVGGSKDAKAP